MYKIITWDYRSYHCYRGPIHFSKTLLKQQWQADTLTIGFDTFTIEVFNRVVMRLSSYRGHMKYLVCPSSEPLECLQIGNLPTWQAILTIDTLGFRQWHTECQESIQMKLKIQMELKETDLGIREFLSISGHLCWYLKFYWHVTKWINQNLQYCCWLIFITVVPL